MLHFKDHFGIPKHINVDFLDIPIDSDILYFIDPFLIANNKEQKRNGDIYSQLKSFFEKLNKDFIKPNRRGDGLLFLDNLHEPNEYHIGYSKKNKGAAISDTRADTIYEALRNNRFAKAGVSITNEAHNVLLLVQGIGQDIMSDTTANVCRNIFAEFTTQQCQKHNIATQKYERHYYNKLTGQWEKAFFELPEYQGKCIILLPVDIMSSVRSYVNHYNYFVAANRIAKDILDGKVASLQTSTFIKILKDGKRSAIIKRIYEAYRKPKAELVQMVIDYPGSLEDFLDYAKEHYPAADFSNID